MSENRYPNILVHINLQNIKDNFLLIKKKSLNKEVGAVVKANAYGTGVKHVVPILENVGCKNFFVSSINEALSLRKFLKDTNNIFVLHGSCDKGVLELIENNCITVINNLNQLKFLIKIATNYKKKVPCVLNFNLSMHRLGIMHYELEELLNLDLSVLDIKYIMGHLSSSDEPESRRNIYELEKFNTICSKFDQNIKKTLANSNAIKLGMSYLFDLIRAGSALYGITKFDHINILDRNLKEAVSIYSTIIQINTVPKGEFVGYNGTFKTEKTTKVAVVPLGYADGYIRIFSNKSYLYISGYSVPVIGSISMDLTIVDVTSIPENLLFIGQKVEILGPNQDIYSLSKIANTISYEILTILMLGRRTKKIYQY